jgi:NAD(P)-dependent dehydrogenase (short-subunit alcohol dehydrogenase family)
MSHVPVTLTSNLEGRVALVTGASSGLGVRAAEVLHAAGARVIAVARRKERLEELAGRLDHVTAEPCDVTDESATREVVRRAHATFGGIDILLNNAGISEAGSAETETTESFRRVLETNVVAAFTISRQVGQGMLARGSGSIINLGSLFGLKGVADAPTGYAVSKAAVHGLTLQLAAQWSGRGVRVNAIAPGPFPSEMNDYFKDSAEEASYARRTALRRVGRPYELDGLLLFLAGDQSSFVTGQVFSADGGWSAI